MHRYLAFAWPAALPEAAAQAAAWAVQLAEAPHWRPAFQHAGLEVWTSASQPVAVTRLSANGAVAIGDIFDRRGGVRACLPGLPEDPLAAARRLAADAWGAYVALLPDPGAGALSVFNDPSGALSVLAWRVGPLAVVSDDLAQLPVGFAPGRLALDWDAITEIFRRPYVSPHLSPLAGATPVVAGDLLTLGEVPSAPVSVWRPAAFVGNAVPIAASRLRETVFDTVSTLASVESSILVEVSGGLDSSIVAAALAETGHAHRFRAALNYYPARREGDERAWAAAVCARHGLPLLTLAQEIGELSGTDYAELADQAAPAVAGLDAPRDRDTEARAAALGATAIFGGQGGDAVFFQMPTAAAVADLLQARGLAGLADPFVAEMARWLGRSVWSVLAEARRTRGLAPTPASVRQFWGPRAREAATRPPHPWLRDLGGTPPGKQVQIHALLGTHEFWGRSRRSRAAPVVQPLLAQPVVELCLSAPSWNLLAGGRDRALARQAFADCLPEAVAQRRSKGMLNTLYARRTAASLPFLRAHLLDGVLAGAGVLDRAAVDAALQPEQLIWRDEGARLSRAAMMESWVRYWQGRVPDLATASRHRRGPPELETTLPIGGRA